jgi:hypothetical protein
MPTTPGVYTVPEGSILLHGRQPRQLDRLAVSAIGGGVGFVPFENLLGRADRVMFSSAGKRLVYFWTWRATGSSKRSNEALGRSQGLFGPDRAQLRPARPSGAARSPIRLSAPTRPDNQRLEFLGDRVLGLVMAEALLARTRAREGQLAPRFNALVRKETCAEVAREIDLGAC